MSLVANEHEVLESVDALWYKIGVNAGNEFYDATT